MKWRRTAGPLTAVLAVVTALTYTALAPEAPKAPQRTLSLLGAPNRALAGCNPDPVHRPFIAPVGDSITEDNLFGAQPGRVQGGGYRMRLFWRGQNAGKQFWLVGTRYDGYTGHEGHGGWTLAQLDAVLTPEWFAQQTPDYLVLWMGHNPDGTPEDMAARYIALVNRSLAQPCVRGVVAPTLIPHVNGDQPDRSRVERAFNKIIRTQLASNPRVAVVEMADLAPDALYDGLHPNDKGYEQAGQKIFMGLEKVFVPAETWPVIKTPGGSLPGGSW